MRKGILLLCIFLLTYTTISTCMAGSVTFSDPMDTYAYTVYNESGHVVGQYNSTDSLILDSSQNYQIFVKPNAVSIFNEPQRGADYMISYFPVGVGAMVLVVIGLGIFVIFRRQAR